MEQQTDQSLFSLNLDAQSRGFLLETTKWARFLAILGFILCVFILLGGLLVATQSEFNRALNDYGTNNTFSRLGPGVALVYIVIAVIYFFPCLYLLRFSNYMRTAIDSDNQEKMTAGFKNLKSMFRFVGIMTIIMISIYLLALIVVATSI